MFTVYILKSIKFDKFYVGQTKDIEKRLAIHNSKRAKWTKRFQPWEIVYKEECDTRSDAMKRELALKRKRNIGNLIASLDASLSEKEI